MASRRAGDRFEFEHVVNQYTPLMSRVARHYVASRETGRRGWVHLAERDRPARSEAATSSAEPPERPTVAGELLAIIRQEIAALPALQCTGITLRAVLDVDSRQVCARLELSTVHQRVCYITGSALRAGALRLRDGRL